MSDAVVVTGVWDNIELQTRVTDPKALKEMTERLSCMPGIAHFLQVDEYPLGDFDDIVEKCKLHFGDALAGKLFSVRCKRAGKHPFTSMEVEKYVGSKLRRECGAAGIELKKPEIEVRIEIRDQRLFVIHNQHDSIGGYPLGSLEQTLVLMSGGFDSTVAAYQIMRRGLMSHFCFFNLGGRAHELGVMEITEGIAQGLNRAFAAVVHFVRPSPPWVRKNVASNPRPSAAPSRPGAARSTFSRRAPRGPWVLAGTGRRSAASHRGRRGRRTGRSTQSRTLPPPRQPTGR